MGENDGRFGKLLASNDGKTRDKAVKVVGRYLSARADPSMHDFLKLWKALFYCMWHSDKPLVQHALADQLAALLHAPPTFETSEMFARAFWRTMAREWHGIDHHRLNKFYTLMRRVCYETFRLLGGDASGRYGKAGERSGGSGWADAERVVAVSRLFAEGPLSLALGASQAGIRMHVCDVFVPELARAGCDSAAATHALLAPMYAALGRAREPPLIDRVCSAVFEALAAPQPEALAAAASDEEEGGEGGAAAKQPAPLPFDAAQVGAALLAIASDEAAPPRNRDAAHSLAPLFSAARGGGGGARVAPAGAAGGLASLQATLQGLVRETKAKAEKNKRKGGKSMAAAKRERGPPSNEMRLELTEAEHEARKAKRVISAADSARLVKRSRHAPAEFESALARAGLSSAGSAAPAEPAAAAAEVPRVAPEGAEGARAAEGGARGGEVTGGKGTRPAKRPAAAAAGEGEAPTTVARRAKRGDGGGGVEGDEGAGKPRERKGAEAESGAAAAGGGDGGGDGDGGADSGARRGKAATPAKKAAVKGALRARTPELSARRRSVSFSPVLENVREYEIPDKNKKALPLAIIRAAQRWQPPAAGRGSPRGSSPGSGKKGSKGTPVRARSPIGTRAQRRR